MKRTILLAGVCVIAMSGYRVSAGETVLYEYDELGRLIAVQQTGTINNGVNTDIEYDEAGNRVNYEVTGSNGAGDGSGTIGDGGTGSGTAPSFSISDATAIEGNDIVFTVTKSNTVSSSYSVSWISEAGSALDGEDYTGGQGTITFAAGEMSKTVTLPTIDNVFYEQTESLYVNLIGTSGGATVTDAQGAGTISDDETPNTAPVANLDEYGVSCLAGTYNVTENDTDADGDTIQIISVSGPLGAQVSGTTSVYVSGTNNPGTYDISYTIEDIHGATDNGLLRLTWASNPACGGGPAQ